MWSCLIPRLNFQLQAIIAHTSKWSLPSQLLQSSSCLLGLGTCIQIKSTGLHSFWLFPIVHHEDKLQAVHSQIQDRPSTQVSLCQARDVCEGGAQVGTYQLHLPHLPLGQTLTDLHGHRKEPRPESLLNGDLCDHLFHYAVHPDLYFLSSSICDVHIRYIAGKSNTSAIRLLHPHTSYNWRIK